MGGLRSLGVGFGFFGLLVGGFLVWFFLVWPLSFETQSWLNLDPAGEKLELVSSTGNALQAGF